MVFVQRLVEGQGVMRQQKFSRRCFRLKMEKDRTLRSFVVTKRRRLLYVHLAYRPPTSLCAVSISTTVLRTTPFGRGAGIAPSAEVDNSDMTRAAGPRSRVQPLWYHLITPSSATAGNFRLGRSSKRQEKEPSKC